MTTKNKNHKIVKIPLGIIIVAILMIIFGLIEVATAFTHSFLGITTSQALLFTYSAVAIGVFYILAGILILTKKRRAAWLAVILLCLDILGRVALVGAGLYPLNSPEQIFSIITGTVIAAIFAIYIALKYELL